jgi:NTP pyrophosphatase (non-canonical NTP hydrolase)
MWKDDETPLAVIKDRIRRFSAERGWIKYHKPRNLAMQVVVEAGELLELFLWSADDGPQPPVTSRNAKVAEELADVVICCMNLAAAMGIDVAEAIEQKMAQNAKKYPVDQAWGRLEKYTELGEKE